MIIELINSHFSSSEVFAENHYVFGSQVIEEVYQSPLAQGPKSRGSHGKPPLAETALKFRQQILAIFVSEDKFFDVV